MSMRTIPTNRVNVNVDKLVGVVVVVMVVVAVVVMKMIIKAVNKQINKQKKGAIFICKIHKNVFFCFFYCECVYILYISIYVFIYIERSLLYKQQIINIRF